ncbi:MAG: NAD(P)-dependent oxidoreductase [Planctomycetota bacterium]
MPDRYQILVSGPRMLRDWERVRPTIEHLPFDFHHATVRQHLDEDELIECLTGDTPIDVAMCGGDRWTAQVFDAAPTLKAVCKWGTGIDAIDQDAARERGVLVRNVPDAFSVPVADTVMCHVLCFARKQPWLTQALRAGSWSPIEGVCPGEQTLGIIGLGNIGQTVARRAAAFGMTLLGADPVRPPQQFLDDTRMELTDLGTLLERSDVVSVNCDLNPTSRHLISTPQLERMKPTAILINTARGPVVDQAALEHSLVEGRIAGAGLDVFETEPLALDSPLRSLDNVLLSPHLAQSSPRACWAVHERVARNACDCLGICFETGERRPHSVHPGSLRLRSHENPHA